MRVAVRWEGSLDTGKGVRGRGVENVNRGNLREGDGQGHHSSTVICRVKKAQTSCNGGSMNCN